MKKVYSAQGKRSPVKIALLVALFIISAALLCGCYMDMDRTVDGGQGLTIDDNTQKFDQLITTPPTVTNTPAPQSTTAGTQVDWTNWDFGATVTDVPSNVVPIGPSGSTGSPSQTGGASATNPPSPGVTPSSTTYATLKSGSKGDDVSTLQARLKELGYYTGTVDGSYGGGTSTAVKEFQAANKLSTDGVAGKATQETLYSFYAVAKKDATITVKPSTGGTSSTTTTKKPSATSTPKPASTNSYTNGKTDTYLRLGSSNAQVKILQNRLIVLGYLTGTADGEYGAATEAAIMAFQKRNDLYEDGVAGPTTLTKLYSSSAKKASSVVANLGSLSQGMSGGAVRALQTKLKALGYYNGSIDGDYGSGTYAAVLQFQTDNGLKQDGIAGTATINAIYGGGSGGGGGTGSGFTASSTGYSLIRSGATNSSNVRTIQSRLKALGYYSGDIDGNYGSGTTRAVKAFQDDMGLEDDGDCGPTTQRMLFGNTTSESASYSSLKPGASGSAVRNLQYTLYELRYYNGKITGSYDSVTEDAVRWFQSNNNLDVDGAAGKQTQRKLYSANAKPAVGKGYSGGGGTGGGTSGGSGYSSVSYGAMNDTVLAIQVKLQSLGFYTQEPNSYYDNEMVNATILFINKNSGKLSSPPADGRTFNSNMQSLLFEGNPSRN